MQADGSCRCCAEPAFFWLSLLAGLFAMRWVIKTSIRAALSLDGADELSRATAAVSKIGVNYMQTTALLFPEHPNVVVREELRERRTGLPCDERSPVHKMSRRPSFEWMRFSEVQGAPRRKGGGAERGAERPAPS